MHTIRPSTLRGARALLTLTGAAVSAGLSAQTAPTTAAPAASAPTPAAVEEEIVVLSPFEVSAATDTGYTATDTLAGTRIRTELRDVGSSLSVITKGFLQDVGATNNATLLQYTTNTEVSGTLGTYTGLGNGQTLNETSTIRSAGFAQRVRGLAAADNTRDFFTTDIPWDSFNVERVDIQRGANAIMFGLGSPAGIINASVNNAGWNNKGQVDLRYGSYGSMRGSLDYNQVLIDDMLSIRVDGLLDNKEFQQDPAYENDHRFSVALRFDPKLIKAKGFNTSFKAKYEAGEIKANRPRSLTPYDNITPWYKAIQQNANGTYTADSGLGLTPINYAADVSSSSNPWIGQSPSINQQQPIWFIDGNTNQLYQIYGGFINRGARSTTGAVGGNSAALAGQKYGDEFPGIRSFSSYAVQAALPGFQDGQYRDKSLTDSSTFDFYNQLIDGDTKKEFANWYAYNIDFSQTAWDDRVGVQVTYDRQWYKNGGQSLLSNPTLGIDILRNLGDRPDVLASAPASNPNFGRAFVAGGPGTGSSYESNREALRASLFAELRASDLFGKDSLLTKVLGKHRLNGVYSNETFDTENRSWQMYAHSQEWQGFWSQNNGSTVSMFERSPVAIIYLGSANAVASNLPGITQNVELASGNVHHFDSTWNAPASVGFADPWTVPATLTNLISNATTLYQNSNPANYVGWNSNVADNLYRYNDGEDLRLVTGSSLAQRKVKSYSGTWQGFLWNSAIVPTLGWRFDEVKSLSKSAAQTGARSTFNLDPTVYTLPTTYLPGEIFKSHSTAGGVVVHLNRLFAKDPLPFIVSLSYNKSKNFQVTNARHDFYGNTIGNPSGETKEYGVTLATKDGKYSLRVQQYETNGKNVSMDTSLNGLASTLIQGYKFRNVFLYRLSNYDLPTREQVTTGYGQRFEWYPGYKDNTTGKVVAEYNYSNPSATPQPANTTLETAAEAIARRDATITAWNGIQAFMVGKGFYAAWQYPVNDLSMLTTRANIEATATGVDSAGRIIYATQFTPTNPLAMKSGGGGTIAPAGLALTSDNYSKGLELEFTANPTQSLRLTINASKTTAVRSNVGTPELDATIAYMDEQMLGTAGDLRQFNGAYVRGNEIRQTYANWRGGYALSKLQDGAAVAELRKWRFNLVGNYTFLTGMLKGGFVGGGYRWQSNNVIGYPMVTSTVSNYGTYDLSKPYKGPSESAIDLWAGYSHKLTSKIDWKIQLNVRNVGDKNGIIPITVQPDGVTPAAYRIAPVQEWSLTNTFSF